MTRGVVVLNDTLVWLIAYALGFQGRLKALSFHFSVRFEGFGMITE